MTHCMLSLKQDMKALLAELLGGLGHAAKKAVLPELRCNIIIVLPLRDYPDTAFHVSASFYQGLMFL
jgi:hypothetical protein